MLEFMLIIRFDNTDNIRFEYIDNYYTSIEYSTYTYYLHKITRLQ